MFITHVSTQANTYIVETGISMDPFKYDTKRLLTVCVKEDNLTAAVYFTAGKFDKVSYSAVTPYTFETWKFLGELSKFIQDIQVKFEKGNSITDSRLISELKEIEPDSFRIK